MSKTKNIMRTWKEFNPDADRSMKDDFQEQASPNQKEIIDYLNNGKVTIAATCSGEDIFTGERVTNTYSILTDGEYSWANILGHYVQKYNLRLPQEFEEKIKENKN